MIDRYTRKEMGEIWSLEQKFRVWLEVELAICEGWHTMGVIPAEDMAVIREKADFELERILELEETTKHDVIAFLTAVRRKRSGPRPATSTLAAPLRISWTRPTACS